VKCCHEDGLKKYGITPPVLFGLGKTQLLNDQFSAGSQSSKLTGQNRFVGGRGFSSTAFDFADASQAFAAATEFSSSFAHFGFSKNSILQNW